MILLRKFFSLLVFAMFLNTVCSGVTFATEPSRVTATELDNEFQRLSQAFYIFLSQQAAFRSKTFATINELAEEISRLEKNQQHITAIALVQRNFAMVDNNFDHKSIFKIIALLLSHNEIRTANRLRQTVDSDGDKALVSNVSFLFAKYYMKRQDWNKTLNALKGIIADLPVEDAHFAQLMTGISLQHLKHHRDAINIYKKVPDTSKYYSAAILNISVAYIRQDWWTDAHLAITNLLKNSKVEISDELTNRLYLVIGYSLLRKEYYRDSREAFRNVEINSRYTNKALLGIALTATSQEDFVSALNALTILKQKKSIDLTVDESHLLLPYIYEKLKQHITASTGYTDALLYYGRRINDAKKTLAMLKAKQNSTSILHNETITSLMNSDDYAARYPRSYIDNYKELEAIKIYLSENNYKQDPQLKRKVNTFYAKYTSNFKYVMYRILELRINYLKSYMSQSRYGLARLFDKSTSKPN